jgi:hypothetical protein
MHPQNIFGEAILLFVTGIVLIVRDRGSAMGSTAYDTLIGCLLILFALIRMFEFLGGSRDGHVMARSLVWLMWIIPVILFGWLLFVHRRVDLGVMLGVSLGFLIGVTIYLAAGAGGYDIITPDQRVGASTGVYNWVRTDGSQHFMAFSFYVILAVALIYLTILSMTDKIYWLLVGVTVAAYIVAAWYIPQVKQDPLATLASLSTLVMLGLGVFTVLIVPG